MSTKEALDAKLNEIKALDAELVKRPPYPLTTYVGEIKMLSNQAIKDAEALSGVGISRELIDDIPLRINACLEAQGMWESERYESEKAEKQWEDESPDAYELRDYLIRCYRYAFMEDSDLIQTVRDIDDGASHMDMVQDLSSLAILGEKHVDLLKRIGFDITLLQKARNLSVHMNEVLSKANDERREDDETKELRDRAYILLKQGADKIKEAGKFLFYGDKNHYEKYLTNYYR